MHKATGQTAPQMSDWSSLERKGVPLGLHSGYNMAPIDRYIWLGSPATGSHWPENIKRAPQERLSFDKALRAITIEAAQVIEVHG
jgi:predicted amidohydrolase YtcJ